jgi:hypothetical protein
MPDASKVPSSFANERLENRFDTLAQAKICLAYDRRTNLTRTKNPARAHRCKAIGEFLLRRHT